MRGSLVYSCIDRCAPISANLGIDEDMRLKRQCGRLSCAAAAVSAEVKHVN
jgi:hypothetical protein